MKKLLTLAALTLGVLAAKAQSTTFKPFRVGFDFGYAVPSGEGSKGGVAFAIEPKYAISDKLALGIRYEAAVTVRGTADSEGYLEDAEAKAAASYLATADYYFNTNSFRPFIGLGAGLFQVASTDDMMTVTETEVVIDDNFKSKFGFTPRIGFDYGHFRAAVDYNVVGKSGAVKNNYLSFKVGFFLGGGRN